MFSQAVGEATEADRREKVDGEARVARIVARKQTGKRLGHARIFETLLEARQAEVFGKLVEQDLDKDTRRRRRFVFVQVHVPQHRPEERVRVQQVRKALGHVAQFVRLEPMNGRVPFHKHLVERRLIRRRVQLAKSLTEQTVEAQIGALLRTTLDNHVGHFQLEIVQTHL